MSEEHKNCLRKQVLDDVSAGLAQSLKSDRKGLTILLLQIVNAIWFATLWESGFKSMLATVIWATFFAASVVAAIALEIRR